jgi:hypothetical protein
MQALIDEFLQCIIHKAVARNAGFASEEATLDSHTKVGAKAAVIGTNMACMCCAFI